MLLNTRGYWAPEMWLVWIDLCYEWNPMKYTLDFKDVKYLINTFVLIIY